MGGDDARVWPGGALRPSWSAAGRGVAAARRCAAGEELLSEDPLLVEVDAVGDPGVCARCARCVGPLLGHLRRAAPGLQPCDVPVLPLGIEGGPAAPWELPGPLPCRCAAGGCTAVYCDGCEERAWAEGHSVLCVGPAGPGSPLRALLGSLFWAGSVWLRLYARHAARLSLDPSCSPVWEAFGRGPARTEETEVLRDACGAWVEPLRTHITAALAPTGAALPLAAARVLTPDGFLDFYRLARANAQALRVEAPTAPLLCHLLGAGPPPGAEALVAHVLQACGGDAAGIPPAGLASGLFVHHSRLNHSCINNAAVVAPAAGEGGRVRVVATRAIAAGEEVTISYLSQAAAAADREERRRELRDAFHFDCLCAVCSDPGG